MSADEWFWIGYIGGAASMALLFWVMRHMNTSNPQTVDRSLIVSQLWVTWNWEKRFQPAGGTRPRGSAHPKGDHSPGVCKAMRLNPRVVDYEVPPPFAKPKPFVHANPKRRRNARCCGNKNVKHCCGVRGLPGARA